MDALLEALLTDVSRYLKKEENINKIKEAYEYAKLKHTGQLRKSGEPFIIHPVAVARILSDLQAGPTTIVAGLLHDVVEDTDATLEELKVKFGEEAAYIIEGVTKLSKLKFTSATIDDNHQKMLLAMAKDIRVVLVKIADRLHNMRTLDSMPAPKAEEISQETLDIYAPIAHRLGLFRIKAELEDRALRYTDPTMYFRVNNLIKAKKDEREESINNIVDGIMHLFKEINLSKFSIKGRVKNIYSIYKKIVRENRTFEDIYDLLAIRIIVENVEECYHSLGVIHANFTPIPRRFKDYIAVPKPNLYQSLHTTVLANDGTLFEVQIRTQAMDDIAENGIAAHWAYKENKAYSKEKEQFEIASKLKWYSDLLKMSDDEDETEDSAAFVETIKQDILTANVYVFSPKGEVYELPIHATPIDFAYRIHSDIGNKMVSATVNGKIVPIDHVLQTGDIVVIKTNKNSSGPSSDWLKIVKSSHAKHKIKSFLNKANKDSIIESGKDQLDRELSVSRITFDITDSFVKAHFEKQGLDDVEDLYLEIGKGLLSPKTVIFKIQGQALDRDALLARQMNKATKQLIAHSDTGVVVEGLSNPKIRLAVCCSPVKDDEIIGYVSKGDGIVVHTKACSNIASYEKQRFIEVHWGTNVVRKYATWIRLMGTNRPNLVADVVLAINALGISIVEMSAVSNSQLQSVIKLKVSVPSIIELNNCMANLTKVAGIYEIERECR